MPSPRSAANPASHPSLPRRASPPDCSRVAASRLVTGLSRASCRDASGLAVLMSTGRRAGLSGLWSARPRPRPRWPGSCASPARPPDRHLLPPPGRSRRPGGWQARAWRLIRVTGRIAARQPRRDSQLQRWAAGYREHRGLGQPGHQSRPREWKAARQMGTHPAAWSDARPVPWATANAPHVGFRLCSCGEAAKVAWALDHSRIARGRQVRLPPGDLDSVSGRARLYYRHAAELFETATRECAAVGGLCAAEARLRDPCS